jgi:acyl-CoA oxidase
VGHGWRTVSDYFQLDELLSPEDVALRQRVRDVMETHVAPVMTKVGVFQL